MNGCLPYSMPVLITFLVAGWVLAAVPVQAQVYRPVSVTGFNNDAIAESGTDASAVTTTALDLSNYILYSAGFANANRIAGGMVDNGTITAPARTYQLADYTASNVLYMSNGGSGVNTVGAGTLTLQTPESFSRVSLLVFASEGNSTLSVVLQFTDGTSYNAGNFTVLDWFGGGGAVYTGFGRTTRLTAQPYTAFGLPFEPRFYPLDMVLPCSEQAKKLESVAISFVSGTTTDARAMVLALSGVDYTPVTVTGVITDAVCGRSLGNIALTATGGSAPLSYSWNTTPVQSTATATGLNAGTYACTITDLNGCVTDYQGTVTLRSTTALTAAARPASICAGEPVALSVSVSGGTLTSYTWTPGNLSGTAVTVNPTATTTYKVTGNDAFGCTASASVTVTVKPTPVASFTVTPAAACLGTTQTVQFTGSAGSAAAFNWNNFDGATVQTGNGTGPYDIVFGTAGTHVVRLQITENGCTSAISAQTVTISTPPVVSFIVDPKTICAGDSVQVKFTGSAGSTAGITWNWNGGIVQHGTFPGPYVVKYNKNALITLSIKEGACDAVTASESVAVIPIPAADFSTNIIKGCVPLVIQFTNASQQADSYAWDFGDGGISTDASPQHVYQTPGDYTIQLTATAQGQCVNAVTKAGLINVRAAPVAAFSAVPGINTPVELYQANFSFSDQSTNADSWRWQFGDGETAAQQHPQHQYQLPGNYQVTLYVRNEIGCVDSITQGAYIVIPDKILQIPNAFSPNGDGVNDHWQIIGLRAYPDCQVAIYNRWGQQVFSSRGYTNPWDGRYHGNPVPVGTYYYVIKNVRGVEVYTGWVAILR